MDAKHCLRVDMRHYNYKCDYNVSSPPALATVEWRYGDEKRGDYADEVRLRLLRIFTYVSQGVIKRGTRAKRMKFQSPLLAARRD